MTTEIIIGLFVIAIILIILELFVIPGFGVSGILGIVALLTGIVFVSDNWVEGVLYTLGSLTLIVLIAYISYRMPGTRRLWKKLFLNDRQSNDTGYVAPKPNYESYVKREGVALSHLRPAGSADFNGERLDVVTEGGYITAGAKIRIIQVEGTRIVVREIRDN